MTSNCLPPSCLRLAALLAWLACGPSGLSGQQYFPHRVGFRLDASRPLILGGPYVGREGFRTPAAFRNYHQGSTLHAEAHTFLLRHWYAGLGGSITRFRDWAAPAGEEKYLGSSAYLAYASPFIGWQSLRREKIPHAKGWLRLQAGPSWGSASTEGNRRDLLTILKAAAATRIELEASAVLQGFSAEGAFVLAVRPSVRAVASVRYDHLWLSPSLFSEEVVFALMPSLGLEIVFFRNSESYYAP